MPDARLLAAVVRVAMLALLAVVWLPSHARPPVVAAASDLKFALTAVAARFEAETGRKVALNFGSSGNFARQIEQGAPFELFFSADEAFVFRLADAGLTRDRGRLYAIGRIVLYVPKGSPLRLDAALAGLRSGWDGVRRVAIANPEHAPYGRAAEEALRALDLWTLVQPRLVLGENIAQAAQFVTSGNADAGIIALSLAVAPELRRHGDHVVLPASLHQPLRQRMVLTRDAGETAVLFHDYLLRPSARAILQEFGFALPGD